MHAQYRHPFLQLGDIVPAHQMTGCEQQDPVADRPAGGVQAAGGLHPDHTVRDQPASLLERPDRPVQLGIEHVGFGRRPFGRVAEPVQHVPDRADPRTPVAQPQWPGGGLDQHPDGQSSQSASSRSSIGFGRAPTIDFTSSPLA